ncbi:MAG: hypothetical protein HXS44_01620 [Theionarchaea archaeon]|nr:hypothetical protein [Theionarchaea archaeon]
MNKTRSGLKTLLIVAIIVCSGLITSFPDMKDTEETPTAHSEENLKSDWCDIMVRASPDIYGSSITRIEITSPHAYTISSHQPVHIPDSYVIEYREGEYRSGDARVDPDLVERLRMSLANFYECKAPYKYIQSKSESSLLVNITFENGKFVTLMSGSPEDCFTPWVAEYDGNLYYQYSGILTSAVQRVLLFLDSFKWYIASEPHYYDGKIYVFAITRLFALDSETKNIVWEVDLIRGGSPPEAADLTIHEGALYMIDIVITTVRISKIDASSGTILWEYSYNYRGLTNFRVGRYWNRRSYMEEGRLRALIL